MTPNHDHATLFLAPPAPPEADGRSQRTADSGTEALRQLRHPFSVQSARATGTTTAAPSHEA
jgi:hypothetical protein